MYSDTKLSKPPTTVALYKYFACLAGLKEACTLRQLPPNAQE